MNQSNDSREKWIDQAVINYLIYYKKLFSNDTILWNENKDSPFLTLALSKSESFNIDSEGNILNIKGEIPAVLHQYDRHKKIVIKLLKKYSHFYFNLYILIFLIIVLYKFKKSIKYK